MEILGDIDNTFIMIDGDTFEGDYRIAEEITQEVEKELEKLPAGKYSVVIRGASMKITPMEE